MKEYKVKIFDLGFQGVGIGKINKKICMIPYSIPDEELLINITQEKKSFSFGKIKSIISESDKRIKPVCKYFEKCGGCNYQHMNFNTENKYKKMQVIQLFNRIANEEHINCEDTFYADEFFYRNQVQFHCDITSGKIGFMEKSTNSVLDIDYCYLMSEKTNLFYQKLRKTIIENKINIDGFTIKSSSRTNNYQLILLFKRIDDFKKIRKIFTEIKEFDSIVIHFYKKNRNFTVRQDIIKGKKIWQEKVGNFVFEIMPNSFFQINIPVVEKILFEIKSFINQKKITNLYDIFGGSGLFSFTLGKYFENIILVENNRDAIKSATIMLEKSGQKNIFVNQKDLYKEYIDIKKNSLILVDPPRNGLGEMIIDTILRSQSDYVIYLSCDPATQARDMKSLKINYQIVKAIPFNMFPRTYHIENLLFLKRTNLT